MAQRAHRGSRRSRRSAAYNDWKGRTVSLATTSNTDAQANAMTIGFEKWMLFLSASIAVGDTATPVFAGDDLRAAAFDLTRGVAESSLGKLPLVFEQNLGQSHPRVRFVARGV